MSDQTIEYSREMGLTHDDFWRLLPRAMGTHTYQNEGDTVHAKINSGRLVITLGPPLVRRIALMHIPYSKVSFNFSDVTEAEQQAFKSHFDLHFQRGGG